MKKGLIKYQKFILEMRDRSENPWMNDEVALEMKARELEKIGYNHIAFNIYQTLDELNVKRN